MNLRKTLKNLESLPLIEDYKRELGESCDYRRLPIAPSMIEDNDTTVVLSKNAVKDYRLLVTTAKADLASIDYPFVILGNRRKVENESIIVLEKFVFCHDEEATLTRRKVKPDGKKILDIAEDDSYNVIAWGRTHGKWKEFQRKSSPLRNLSDEYIKKYNIREEEFNIDLEELDEYSAVTDAVSMIDLEKEVYQMIIMPTGEVAMLGVEDDTYHKFPNVELATEKSLEEVPVEEFDTKFLSPIMKSKRGK